MKNFTIILLLALFMVPELAFGEATQGNWRWRNDDNNEAAATWAAQENEPIVVNSDDIIRLRIELHGTDELIFPNLQLGYKLESQTNYTTLTESVDFNHFALAQSSHFANGDPTTNQLTNTHTTFYDGLMIESFGENPLTLPPLNSTELEFAIKPTSNIRNEVYHFKVINDIYTNMVETTQISLTYNNLITSLSEDKSTIKFKIFPNPVVDAFTVNADKYPALLKIIDLNGRLILSKNVVKNERIDISSVKKGIYMVVVNNETHKLIKE